MDIAPEKALRGRFPHSSPHRLAGTVPPSALRPRFFTDISPQKPSSCTAHIPGFRERLPHQRPDAIKQRSVDDPTVAIESNPRFRSYALSSAAARDPDELSDPKPTLTRIFGSSVSAGQSSARRAAPRRLLNQPAISELCPLVHGRAGHRRTGRSKTRTRITGVIRFRPSDSGRRAARGHHVAHDAPPHRIRTGRICAPGMGVRAHPGRRSMRTGTGPACASEMIANAHHRDGRPCASGPAVYARPH